MKKAQAFVSEAVEGTELINSIKQDSDHGEAVVRRSTWTGLMERRKADSGDLAYNARHTSQ